MRKECGGHRGVGFDRKATGKLVDVRLSDGLLTDIHLCLLSTRHHHPVHHRGRHRRGPAGAADRSRDELDVGTISAERLRRDRRGAGHLTPGTRHEHLIQGLPRYALCHVRDLGALPRARCVEHDLSFWTGPNELGREQRLAWLLEQQTPIRQPVLRRIHANHAGLHRIAHTARERERLPDRARQSVGLGRRIPNRGGSHAHTCVGGEQGCRIQRIEPQRQGIAALLQRLRQRAPHDDSPVSINGK